MLFSKRTPRSLFLVRLFLTIQFGPDCSGPVSVRIECLAPSSLARYYYAVYHDSYVYYVV